MAIDNEEKLLKHNREFWLGHSNAWENSNIAQPEYCKIHDLKYSMFVYWRGLIAQEKVKSKPLFIKANKKAVSAVSSDLSRGLQAKLPNGIIVNIPLTLEGKHPIIPLYQ